MSARKKSCRKRKVVELFSPLSTQEEGTLRQALHASLRPIPSCPDISEDEIEDESKILSENDQVGRMTKVKKQLKKSIRRK
jgi:hypothetical protein